jgi:hypothetical protein
MYQTALKLLGSEDKFCCIEFEVVKSVREVKYSRRYYQAWGRNPAKKIKKKGFLRKIFAVIFDRQ